ncbi:MAG TPA: sulfotransferase, partial [Steroidobacteraceae bacterium]|nr:sulfotransferase [Steroidobacteraceae bacterium]
LFREFDAAGDVNEAWFSLKLGAHIMKQRLRYDGSQEAQSLRSWMQEIEQGPDVARVGESGPIFIVGMPRTGTTLLDRILSNHPDIESLGERNDFSAAVSEASDCFFDSLLKTTRDGVLQRLDFDRAGKLYLARLRRAPGSTRFVIDKNPKNLFNIPLILRAIPNARVLCLMRDPTDSCFSNLKELFQGGAYPYSYALDDLAEHCMLAHEWIRYWAAAAPSAVRVVRYEELVANPDQVIEPLLKFIGADFHSGLTDIESNEAPVSTASSSQVRESIHVRGVGAWARYEKHLQPLRERLAQLGERVDS